MDEDFKSIILSILMAGLIFLILILGIILPITTCVEKSEQKKLELEKYRIEMEYKYKYNEVEE